MPMSFFRGKPSRRFHFLAVRVVFILSVLAGFAIFWSGNTLWICFRLFSALWRLDFWSWNRASTWATASLLPYDLKKLSCTFALLSLPSKKNERTLLFKNNSFFAAAGLFACR